MFLAKVIGSVVSTVKHPSYRGTRLMVVQPVKPSGQPEGIASLAVDTVGSGAGETVLVLREGKAAGEILDLKEPPIRSLIVGIVDRIDAAGD
jgi:ethanolamine utilization protein EutN